MFPMRGSWLRVTRDCPECLGAGLLYNTTPRVCPMCNGDGWIPYEDDPDQEVGDG